MSKLELIKNLRDADKIKKETRMGSSPFPPPSN